LLKYILTFLFPALCFGSLFFKEGTNLKHSSLIFSGGVQQEVFGILTEQYEIGYFSTKRNNYGAKGSGFGGYSIGITSSPDNVYAQLLVGAVGLTTTDSQLGGNVAFKHDFSFGVKDRSGNGVGLGYCHISNAGLWKPNVGRDYIMFKVKVGL